MAGKYKTMTLIEEGELERLRQRQIKDYNPSLKSLVSVQEQIEKLFNDSELDDENKLKIMYYLQNKFGNLYKNFKNSPGNSANVPPVVVVPPVVATTDEDPMQDGDQHDPAVNVPHLDVKPPTNNEGDEEEDEDEKEENFIDATTSGDFTLEVNLPHQYQKKFDQFQEFLSQHKNVIRSNSTGQLVLDGKLIPETTYSDLLRSFYVRNVNMNLNGLPNLLGKLKTLNVDPDLFSNKDAKNTLIYMRKFSQSGKGKTFMPPPGQMPKILRVFR